MAAVDDMRKVLKGQVAILGFNTIAVVTDVHDFEQECIESVDAFGTAYYKNSNALEVRVIGEMQGANPILYRGLFN